MSNFRQQLFHQFASQGLAIERPALQDVREVLDPHGVVPEPPFPLEEGCDVLPGHQDPVRQAVDE